jgi:hypothetical protein
MNIGPFPVDFAKKARAWRGLLLSNRHSLRVGAKQTEDKG